MGHPIVRRLAGNELLRLPWQLGNRSARADLRCFLDVPSPQIPCLIPLRVYWRDHHWASAPRVRYVYLRMLSLAPPAINPCPCNRTDLGLLIYQIRRLDTLRSASKYVLQLARMEDELEQQR